jgi:heat shock protein HtpX
MYQQIDANKRNTWVLLFLFIGVLAAAGYAFGLVNGDEGAGLVFALLVSLGSVLFSWFLGDKLVLWTAGATEITDRSQNTYIWNLVENLCIASGLPRPRIYLVQDASPNAFATGRDPQHASIALTTGIIERLENEELEGVIAHELSHVKNLDTRYMILVAVLVGTVSMLGDWFLRGGFRRRSSRDEGGGVFMIVGILFLVLSPLIGQLIKFAISRQREYLADASAALLTRYPEGLARALEKISSANIPLQHAPQASAHLWIADPSGKQVSVGSKLAGLFSTHPPIADRIARLRGMTR